MAELKYSKQATKYLQRMQETHAKKMRNSLQNIAEGNDEGLDIKPMTSLKAYRLRQGNYRALYFYRGGGRLLIVAKIGTRGDFYK